MVLNRKASIAFYVDIILADLCDDLFLLMSSKSLRLDILLVIALIF